MKAGHQHKTKYASINAGIRVYASINAGIRVYASINAGVYVYESATSIVRTLHTYNLYVYCVLRMCASSWAYVWMRMWCARYVYILLSVVCSSYFIITTICTKAAGHVSISTGLCGTRKAVHDAHEWQVRHKLMPTQERLHEHCHQYPEAM